KRLQCGRRARFRRIEKRRKPRKRQRRFVANPRMCLAWRHVAPCDTENAESFGAERVELLLQRGGGPVIVRANAAVGGALSVFAHSTQAHHVFRRSLDDKQPRLVVCITFNQYRDAAPLEVKWNLIELSPALHVDLRVLENGIVEWTLEPGLKVAVDVGQFQNPRTVLAIGINMAL